MLRTAAQAGRTWVQLEAHALSLGRIDGWQDVTGSLVPLHPAGAGCLVLLTRVSGVSSLDKRVVQLLDCSDCLFLKWSCNVIHLEGVPSIQSDILITDAVSG